MRMYRKLPGKFILIYLLQILLISNTQFLKHCLCYHLSICQIVSQCTFYWMVAPWGTLCHPNHSEAWVHTYVGSLAAVKDQGDVTSRLRQVMLHYQSDEWGKITVDGWKREWRDPLGLVGYIATVITTNICQWLIQRLSQVQGVT